MCFWRPVGVRAGEERPRLARGRCESIVGTPSDSLRECSARPEWCSRLSGGPAELAGWTVSFSFLIGRSLHSFSA
jgi:hypothetical protein